MKIIEKNMISYIFEFLHAYPKLDTGVQYAINKSHITKTAQL